MRLSFDKISYLINNKKSLLQFRSMFFTNSAFNGYIFVILIIACLKWALSCDLQRDFQYFGGVQMHVWITVSHCTSAEPREGEQ